MRLHRFFIPSDVRAEGVNSLSDAALAHQLKSVFRFHEGSKLVFFNGTGVEYVSEIVSLSKGEVAFRVDETRAVKPKSGLRLTLAFSLIKKDNAEWILEKCTELGVSKFVPLVSERSEKKGLNMERARRIVIEASEQSGRADVPGLSEPQDLSAFIGSLSAEALASSVAFHTEGKAFDKAVLPGVGEAVAFVGPEGGWTPNEIALFKEKGATIAMLNLPVLRAETAAVAVASIALF